MKKTIVIGCLLFVATLAMAQEDKHVLFIGNSYTDVNNLPQMVQKVSESAGERMTYQSNTPGGCTFQQHCTNNSMTLIRQGGWDVVVLQEQSQLPSFPQGQVEQQCFPYAKQLVDSVYANNPDGEAMFYMTWGRKNGDQENARYFPVLGTYEGMDSMLYERYMYMARANDASVCPVGRVWRYLRTNNREIELYSSDESHPSLAGSYAAACAFYTMIFHATPLNIRYNPQGLDSVQASTIRAAVKHVVFDTLSFWLRQDTLPDTTQHDTTYHDTTGHDTTHVGLYRILDASMSVQLYPNPTNHSVTLASVRYGRDCKAELFDLCGRRFMEVTLDQPEVVVSMEHLLPGVYLWRVTDPSSSTTYRVIKR